MNVSDALQHRSSIRAFLDREVSRDQIEQLLAHARCAPSSTNMQPWQVLVVSGEKKKALCADIVAAFEGGDLGQSEFLTYPEQWFSPYNERRKACGLQMYSTLGITREDKAGQRRQWIANYRSFDAPTMLLFYLHRDLPEGSVLDYGMFLQSIMLMACEMGLGTCPQASLNQYPDIMKAHLAVPEEHRLLCGMALGYPEQNHIVNGYRTPRETVETFAQFYD